MTMRIKLLGPIHLTDDQGDRVEVAERHLRVLLVSLATAEGHPVSADTLTDRLWGSDAHAAELPEHPGKVLRTKLSRLRSVLEHTSPGSRSRLQHTPAGYVLQGGAQITDLGQFRTAVEEQKSLPTSSHKADSLESALSMLHGEPFGELNDQPWLAASVAELNRLRSDALQALAETHLELGHPELALSIAQQSSAEQSVQERLVAVEMTALYQLGRQADALQTFEAVRGQLADDLGVDPSPPLRELHGKILRQEPQLLPEDKPVDARRPSANRTTLPAEASPLIGRQTERQQITRLLGHSRLVTLTGIGGVGKTRLATRIAHDVEAEFAHGVWFVDLTDLTQHTAAEPQNPSAERVAALVGAVLKLPKRDVNTADADQLAEVLRDQSMLLVLDNAEHVIGEAGAFVAALLPRVPGLQILITSREPLGLAEEHRFDLSALNTEPLQDQNVSDAADFFRRRAQATDSSFQLNEQTLPAVAELTHRLDGLPLALELAAAQVKGISVHSLLERLCHRLDLLSRSGPSVPHRQQTLRGLIDWSWSLLSAAERTVLRRMAVHPGSNNLETLEAITSDGPAEDASQRDQHERIEHWKVAEILIRLVDRSMVTVTKTACGLRYGLLESIAVFAGEKLDDAGEREGIAGRHAQYYLDIALDADRGLRGPQQRKWLRVLDAERAQLRHAFDHALTVDDGHTAVRLTVANFWHQWIFGCYSSLSEELDAAVQLPGPKDEDYAAAVTLAACLHLCAQDRSSVHQVEHALALFPASGTARARVQWFAGTSLLAVGEQLAGEKHLDEAISTLEASGEDWDLAVAIAQRSWFQARPGGTPPRLPDGRDPEQVLRRLGDGWGLIQVHTAQQRLAELNGQHHSAAAAAEQALQVAESFCLRAEASYLHSLAAVTALRDADVPLATDQVARARALAADTSYRYGQLAADAAAAMIARYCGDFAQAHRLIQQWVANGGREVMLNPTTHLELGFLAVERADLTAAEEALHSLWSLVGDHEDLPVAASIMELTAAIHTLGDDPERAAAQLQAAARLRNRLDAAPDAVAQRDITRVQARLAQHPTAPPGPRRQAAEPHPAQAA